MAVKRCDVITDLSGRELTAHGSPAFPIACYDHDFRDSDVSWHWHEELEAVAAVMGDTLVQTSRGALLVPEGCGFFLPSGVLHACVPVQGSDCAYHSLVFHARLVGGSMESVFWQRYLTPLLERCPREAVLLRGDVSWQAEALGAIETAWQLCVAEPEDYEFSVREHLSRLILLLSHNLSPAGNQTGRADQVKEDRIKAMLLFIQEHYAEDIRIAQIAASAAVSESECLRCFQQLIGTTPNRYLIRYRLDRAEELLKTTALSITEIGGRCGFREMSYFAKAFRLRFGQSPSQWRKEPS